MRRALVGVVGVILLLVALSGPTMAADNPGLADFEPRSVDVEPGGTVEIDLTMQVVSTYDDEAVESLRYNVTYDPEILSVADVEQGPWLQGGEKTTVSFDVDVDEEAGRLSIEQARNPPEGGVIGDGTTATVTFDVDPEAPYTNTTVEYDSYQAQMLEYPLPTLHQRTEATIIVTDTPTERGVEDLSGFGFVAAIGALLLSGALVRRRQTE